MREARELVEQNGIVFIDEIDKITARSEFRGGGDVSREGVQRDLLPLIEGTTVNTKHGPVKTDHVLFICSGAFHMAKPSDMLPELQGRLPIRVSLASLGQDDFRRILTEPEASLVKQYKALLATEKVELTFKDDAIDELARLSAEINETVENIGARRLHTVMEKLLEEISFTASDSPGQQGRDRCRLRARPRERARQEHRSQQVRALSLEAVGGDQVDEIGRAVQAPQHERDRGRGDDQGGGAPQQCRAPARHHASAAGTAAGRVSRSSTIGQCIAAETRPSAIEIHHIMS